MAALAPDGVGGVGAGPEDFDPARDVARAFMLGAGGLLTLRDEGGDERKMSGVGPAQIGAGECVRGIRNRSKIRIMIKIKNMIMILFCFSPRLCKTLRGGRATQFSR